MAQYYKGQSEEEEQQRYKNNKSLVNKTGRGNRCEYAEQKVEESQEKSAAELAETVLHYMTLREWCIGEKILRPDVTLATLQEEFEDKCAKPGQAAKKVKEGTPQEEWLLGVCVGDFERAQDIATRARKALRACAINSLEEHGAAVEEE